MNYHPNRGVLLTSLLLGLLGALLLPATAEASIFVVNTTDDLDDGQCDTNHCSLREAINAANANSGPDQIHFDLPGWEGSSNHIHLDSTLPPLTDDSTIIDGRTEPDYAGMPIITIHEASIDMEIEAGLLIYSNNNEIYGLVLAGFGITIEDDPYWYDPSDLAGGAIVINGSHNLIEHNTIGHGAMWNAVGVRLSGPGNNVIDNLISGNGVGIVANQPNNKIQGNLIGPDADGDTPVQTRRGIVLENGSNGTLIGGADSGKGNVISGNDRTGLDIRANDCEVYGNLIGVNAAGTSALPNSTGVQLWYHSVQIGGSLPGQGNVISGNTFTGIYVMEECKDCAIQGNKIGTNISGTQLIPNGGDGIYSMSHQGLTIGGNSTVMGNLIMGNQENGISLDLYAAHHIVVHNTIAQNGGHGIGFGGIQVRKNTFSQNSIYDNGGLGIYINNPGADPFGNNDGIQPPKLDSSTVSGTACALCKIEVFIAEPDPSGAGEGKEYFSNGYADFFGNFSIPINVSGFCTPITATATDPDGSTSEFSQNIHANCFQKPPDIFYYPLWTFIIVVFGAVAWRLRRAKPGLSRWVIPLGGLAGGLIFWAFFTFAPFIEPEPTPLSTCGDGVVEEGEQCDGDDLTMCLSGQVCENCKCITYMSLCGNGVVDDDEQCDGDDLTMCLSGQVCENCKCITYVEAEPENEICVYEALQNSNCRESEYPESDLVETLTKGDTADLIALNPEYTHGLFDLESGKQCWIWLGLMGGDENPFHNCPLEIIDPPVAPSESVRPPEAPRESDNACSADLDERSCIAAGGEYVEDIRPPCVCPEE